ncbi:hypothetical protein F5Y13DRAFT_188748 [Hypoxylon sp. FL1857]|nr:hypothetical protein F5Y13DRAFT_188748 [Hypoxylon sp. FL1857]
MASQDTEAILAIQHQRAEETQLSMLELLPYELKHAVAVCCNPEAVINLALTGPTFYAFIKDAEVSVSAKIIKHTIGPDFIGLATALHLTESSLWSHVAFNGTEQSQAQLITFLTDESLGCDRPAQLRHSYNLNDTIQMLQFRSAVDYYASILSEEARLRAPKSGDPMCYYSPFLDRVQPLQLKLQSSMPVSATELGRYTKALYLMQLGCNLYKRPLNNGTVNWRSGPVYRAAQQFWTRFAPWEHQQVRCVQTMLEDHMFYLMYPQDFGRKAMRNPFKLRELIGIFLLSHDLCETMEIEKHGTAKSSIEGFQHQLSDAPMRREAWFSNDDEPWLEKNPVNGDVSLNAEPIFARYPEDDSGPRDAWLQTLLFISTEDPALHSHQHMNNYLGCETCLTLSGFVFLDRAKLDTYSGGLLQTTDYMVNASSDMWIIVELLRFHTWGRSVGYHRFARL